MKETIYCSYSAWGWIAACRVGNASLKTTKRHGGPRQAADDILEQSKKLSGVFNVTMRRLTTKTYELEFEEGI